MAGDGDRPRSLILSVMHTGTTTLKDSARPRAFEMQAHVHETRAFPCSQQAAVIGMPIRDPLDTWRSWMRRGRSEKLFRLSWLLLDWFWTEFRDKIVVVPVDRPERDAALAELSERSELPLETDWTPLNAFKGERVDVTAPMPDEIRRHDIVRRFMPEEMKNGS